LSEQLDGPLGPLLRAAQKDVPPESVVAATVGAVSALPVAASLHTALAAKAKAKGSVLLLKALLTGFAGGVVVVGGAEAIHYAVTQPEHAPVSAVPSHAKVANRPAAPADAPAREAATMPPQPATRELPLPVPARHGAAPEPTGKGPAAPTPATDPAMGVEAPVTDPAMELEVRLLDEARSALSAHRGRDALDALGRYAQQTQGRRLAPEAAYLEMEAYVLLGDREAAMRSARDLLARYPGGPHVARARHVLSMP
jgi:hypothetical protein